MKFLIYPFIAIIILSTLISAVRGDNYTNVTLDPMEIIAPYYSVWNYTFFNTTYFLPVNCSYDYNFSNTTRCEIDRTMNQGETYVKDSQSCNLRMSCPDCICEQWENKSYYFKWNLYTENETIYIVNMENNDTRQYHKSDNFNFEDEFQVDCPTFEELAIEYDREFIPINITQDEWYVYCLEPFGMYGQTIKDLSYSFHNLTRKTAEDMIVLINSNERLAEENGRLSQNQENWDQCKAEVESKIDKVNLLEEQLTEKKTQLDGCNNKDDYKDKYVWMFWTLLCINIGYFGVILSIKLFKKIIGLDRGEIQ